MQPTSSLSAYMIVSVEGTTLSVTADVMGDADVLDADFTLVFRGEEHVLPHVLHSRWAAEIALDEAPVEGEVVTVAFHRDDGDDALSSTVTTVPPFTLDPLPASISLSMPLTVTWSPVSADPMEWRTDDLCRSAGDSIVPDVGSVTITPDAWDTIASCMEDLIFSRTRRGQTDPAFEGGYIFYAWQLRQRVMLTP